MKHIKTLLQEHMFDIYMVLILVLTFLRYTEYIGNIYFVILALFGLISIVLNKSIFYLLPLALAGQMSFKDMRENVDITIMFGSAILLLITIDVIVNRKLKKLGYLSLPLVLLAITGIFTAINGISIYASFVGWFQLFMISILYTYFLNTLDKETPYKTIGKLFMYLSILVSAEMVHFVAQSDLEFIEVIQLRSIDLGWENLNIIIYVNLVTVPLIGYLVTQARYKIFYMFASSFIILGIMLTLSRSSIISLAVFIVVLIPLIIVFDKNKKQLLIQGSLFLVILGILVFYFEQSNIISDYFKTLLDRDFDDLGGRWELIVIAWDNFLLHPVFGTGGIFSSRYLIEEAGYHSINYHNTIAQTTTLGVFGLGAFGFLCYRKFKLIFRAKDPFKWFAFVLIIVTVFINGMVQPMYYYTSYMMYLFLILALIEVKQNKKDN